MCSRNRRKRPKKGLVQAVGTVLLLTGLLTVQAAQRELDYAVEDAAYETIKLMTRADLPVAKIAFLGLFNDQEGLGTTFRAGLVRVPGAYDFYARSQAELDLLTGEIEFGDRKADIMDEGTIQRFGQRMGVEALLYGVIQEATAAPGQSGLVRMTMSLGNVETGQIMWTGNIRGDYQESSTAAETPKIVRDAVLSAMGQAVQQLAERKTALGRCRVYFLPLYGKDAAIITPIARAELVNVGDQSMEFFSELADARSARMMQRIADDLKGGGTSADIRQFRLLNQQISQLVEAEDMTGGGTETPEKPKVMALTGQVTESTTEGPNKARVALTFNLHDVNTNHHLWAANVEGEIDTTPTQTEVLKDDAMKLVTFRNTVIAGGILLGLFILLAIFRMLSTPR